MSGQVAQKLPEADVFDFTRDYYGRRVEVTWEDGTVLTGKVAWYFEGYEDDELGITLDDVEFKATGEKIAGMAMRCSDIDTFIPLEGKNSEEEINRLWPKPG